MQLDRKYLMFYISNIFFTRFRFPKPVRFPSYSQSPISYYLAPNIGEYFDLVSLFVKNLTICKLFVYKPMKKLPHSIRFDPKFNTYILDKYDKYLSKQIKSNQNIHVFDHLWVKVE